MLKVKPRERAFKQFKCPVLNVILCPVPEAAVTFLCIPDDGCDGHPKNVENDFAVNKYLHTVSDC